PWPTLLPYTTLFRSFYVNLEGDLGADTAQYLEQEHHFVKVMSVDPAAFEGWIAGSNLPRGQGTMAAILVDPAGLAMMFYTADISDRKSTRLNSSHVK